MLKLNTKKDNQLLVSSFKKEIQNLIYDGASVTWDSYKMESYVTKITQSVYDLEEKVEDILGNCEAIDKLLAQLENCKYGFSIIADILDKIQKYVDELSLKPFSNLLQWVQILDSKVIYCDHKLFSFFYLKLTSNDF